MYASADKSNENQTPQVTHQIQNTPNTGEVAHSQQVNGLQNDALASGLGSLNQHHSQTVGHMLNQGQSAAQLKAVGDMLNSSPKAQQLKAIGQSLNGQAKAQNMAGLSAHMNNPQTAPVQKQAEAKDGEIETGEAPSQLQRDDNNANPAAPIQRMVSFGQTPRVYAPRSIRKFTAASYTNEKYLEGLKLILGGNPVIDSGEPLEALFIEHNVAHDEREAIRAQFREINNVYHYDDQWGLQGAAPASKNPVMEPGDMGDSTAQVPNNYVENQACVVQALQSLGKNVPGTGAVGSNLEHHAYSKQQGLDYRTDSDYLKLYKEKYGLNLVYSGTVAWNAIPWDTLGGAGDYVATSYNDLPGANDVGHMVAVRVANNQGALNVTVIDQQNLTKPNLDQGVGYTKYIFK